MYAFIENITVFHVLTTTGKYQALSLKVKVIASHTLLDSFFQLYIKPQATFIEFDMSYYIYLIFEFNNSIYIKINFTTLVLL